MKSWSAQKCKPSRIQAWNILPLPLGHRYKKKCDPLPHLTSGSCALTTLYITRLFAVLFDSRIWRTLIGPTVIRLVWMMYEAVCLTPMSDILLDWVWVITRARRLRVLKCRCVFLSSTSQFSNFSNFSNFSQYGVNADWFAASWHLLCCLTHCLMADSIVGLVFF